MGPGRRLRQPGRPAMTTRPGPLCSSGGSRSSATGRSPACSIRFTSCSGRHLCVVQRTGTPPYASVRTASSSPTWVAGEVVEHRSCRPPGHRTREPRRDRPGGQQGVLSSANGTIVRRSWDGRAVDFKPFVTARLYAPGGLTRFSYSRRTSRGGPLAESAGYALKGSEARPTATRSKIAEACRGPAIASRG